VHLQLKHSFQLHLRLHAHKAIGYSCTAIVVVLPSNMMLPSLKIKLGGGNLPGLIYSEMQLDFLKLTFIILAEVFVLTLLFFFFPSKIFKVYIAKDLRLSKSFEPGICTDLNT